MYNHPELDRIWGYVKNRLGFFQRSYSIYSRMGVCLREYRLPPGAAYSEPGPREGFARVASVKYRAPCNGVEGSFKGVWG